MSIASVRKQLTVPFPIRRISTDALDVGTQASGSRGRGHTSDAKRNQCVVNRTAIDNNNNYYRYSRYTNDRIAAVVYVYVHVIFTLC